MSGLLAVLAHPIIVCLNCTIGLALAAVEQVSTGGANILAWAAMLASLTGLLGMAYTIFRGERDDRRDRDRERRRRR